MEVSKVSFRVQVKLDFKSLGQFLLYHYYTQVSGLFSLLLSILALVFAVWRWPVLTVQGKCVLILIATDGFLAKALAPNRLVPTYTASAPAFNAA